MPLDVWLSFVLVVCAAVLSPGPAVLLALTHGAQSGPMRAMFAILGNVSGLAVLITLTALGLGAILGASADVFFWLRIAGGGYLIYLGVKLLRAKPQLDLNTGEVRAMMPTRRKAYVQGVGVALSNPKAILLIGALFPQFINASEPIGLQFTILGATLIVLSFSALMMFATVSGALVARGKNAISGKLNKISGALFIAFGAALAAGSR
ncbi:MAG: LysE family translocator [Magnetovibrio sp.]|nr:LysE family translocator [Magnetovibrio sp.]